MSGGSATWSVGRLAGLNLDAARDQFRMSRTFMIRHGKPLSAWGENDDPDPGLDDAGRAQAEAAADWLMTLPGGQRPRQVLSSPLRRCLETAEPFARRIGAEVRIDPRFGEIPTPKGLSAADRRPWLRSALALDWGRIAGELDYDVWRRAVGQGLIEWAGAAVFSHFVAINAAVSCAEGGDAVISFQPDYASATIFAVEHGRLLLIERGRQAETQVL
jgi:broad specificity phosphatase PhoE